MHEHLIYGIVYCESFSMRSAMYSTHMRPTGLLHSWVSMQIWCCCWCFQEVKGSLSLRSAMYSTQMCPTEL